MEVIALTDTWLKKANPDGTIAQADALPDDMKVRVEEGKKYFPPGLTENEDEDEGVSNGHLLLDVGYGGGEWWIYPAHWKLPWLVAIADEHGADIPGWVDIQPAPKKLPEWNEVNWNEWSAPVSKYFTVGEVTNMSRERIPTATDIKKNIIAIARKMDDIREWWGGPLGVNSWYRPWHVNARIGSRAPNHPNGYGIDFRPLNGSVWELQKRFQQEWYNAGKWNGGFGLGARKGFVHLDLRGKRAWNY